MICVFCEFILLNYVLLCMSSRQQQTLKFNLTQFLACSFFLCDYPMFCIAGVEQTRLLGAEVTAFTIDGLQPDEALVIGVAAVVDQRVGEAVTLSARTNPHGGSVSGLRIVDVTSQRIRISWSTSTRATGYKITWRRDNGKQ